MIWRKGGGRICNEKRGIIGGLKVFSKKEGVSIITKGAVS